MWIKRSLLAVGHGAFCWEHFEFEDQKYNIIYDCGSSSKREFLDREIEYVANGVQQHIDAIFISHLDRDHVNGLAKLIEKGIKIGAIYLPFIDNTTKAIMKLGWSIKRNYDAISAVQNALELLTRRQNTVLFRVLPREGDGGNADDKPRPIIGDGQIREVDGRKIRMRDVRSGQNLALPWLTDRWMLKPFNFRQDELMETIRQELGAIAQRCGRNLDEIGYIYADPNINRGIKDDIRNVYKRHGGLNLNSMTVYSGPWPTQDTEMHKQVLYIRDDQSICEWTMKHHFGGLNNCDFMSYNLGCLYTGDYCAKQDKQWGALKNSYRLEWDMIGCVQLPHHGSERNFNNQFATMNVCFFASSKSNDQKHLGKNVVATLRRNGRDIFAINEYINTRVTLVGALS